jgi:rhamnosyltransferase
VSGTRPGGGTPSVTVVMRARDEARWIARSLEMVFRQRDVELEVVCVDSGSTDGTLEIVRHHPARLIQIEPTDFTYSHALNVGAAAGAGEYVVCLNADAEPVDERWLIELLRPLLDDPRVAATYGRQVPRRQAHPTVRRDYAWAFGDTAPEGCPPFVSMVSSAYRRSLWERHPFWSRGGAGDDSEWVRWALREGYRVVYAPRSAVFHSHDYTALDHYRKQRREQRVNIELYGRLAQWAPPTAALRFLADCLRDARFVAASGEWGALPSAVAYRFMQAAGRVHGYWLGRDVGKNGGGVP